MEDQSDPTITQASDDIQQQMDRIKSLSNDLDMPCETAPEATLPPATASNLVKGLNMVFATSSAFKCAIELELSIATTNGVFCNSNDFLENIGLISNNNNPNGKINFSI